MKTRSLIQSNLRSEVFLNQSLDLICIAGMDGYFKYINPAWEYFLGYEQEEILSKSYFEFIHPDDREMTSRVVANLADGQQIDNFENRFIHKYGFIRNFSWTITPSLKDQLMYCTGRDTTYINKSENAFYHAQQKLIDSQEMAKIGWWEYDLQADQFDLCDFTANIFGSSHNNSNLNKEKFLQLVHPDWRVSQKNRIVDLIIEGKPFEFPILKIDGNKCWIWSQGRLEFDSFGKPIKVVGMVQDITERKQVGEIAQRQFRELQILQSISSICLENVDEYEILAQVTKVIGNRFYPDHFGIMLVDDTQGVLRVHPTYSGISPEDYDKEIVLGEGVTGRVAKTNKALRIDDVSQVDNYLGPLQKMASELCVPISLNDKVFGVINAESLEISAFTDADERLMKTVADQLALTLQKIRLFQTERNRRIEAETQREASKLLTMSLELDEVLSTILDNLTRVIEFDQASIHLIEKEQVWIVASHGFKKENDVVGYRYSHENKLIIDIINSKAPLILKDINLDDRFEDFGFVKVRSWMGIPLIEKGEVIGMLTVDSLVPGTYTQGHADLVQGFANNAAGAIVKARLFEEEKKRRLEAEILGEISSIVTQTLDLHTILNSILRNLQRYLEFDSAGIFLEEKGNLKIVATYGFDQPDIFHNRMVPKNHQLYQEILKRRSVLILRNVKEDDRFEDFGSDEEIRGWMGVPLIDQGKVIGYVSFDSKTPGTFTNQMGQLAQLLVNHTSSAITKAQLFEETQLGLKRLEALHEIDQIITSSVDLSFAIKHILKIVVSQLEIDAAIVMTYDSNHLIFNHIASINFNTSIFVQGYQSKNYLSTRVAQERKIISVTDLDEFQNQFDSDSSFTREGFNSYIGVPLIVKGDMKGVLEIYEKAHSSKNKEWEEFLQRLASQLAIAIDNAQMFENLQISNIEIKASYDATIEGWAQALELKDMETEGHCQRVVEFTLRLAQAMGISAENLVHIRRGALLHDIGKMGVPDAILHKPGKLTVEEWEIMRQHPSHAMKWLSSIDYLKPALDIPYCHHEKWDGSGYPQGLKGDEIPISARIFAIVDVWDALRSDRPYRKAWSKEKTLAHIKEQSGKHFDPRVVDKFIELVENNEIIKE